MNKLDGLFKRKLEDLALEPRSEAWIKLEANLSKKNKGLVWFRSAAALLLMGLLITSIIWLQRREENQQVAEQLKGVNPSSKSSENKLKEDSISQSTIHEPNKIIDVKRKSNSTKPKTINAPIVSPIIDVIELKPLITETLSTEPVAEATIRGKPIVIEYTLESIIPQKKETFVAEIDEKKNGLQKALDFAREAKNSDSPLGGIRQAKDDLFALNFKKDKQKKQ